MSQVRVTRWAARLGGVTLPCATGRGGIGAKQGEGDGITPVGQYTITEWLVRKDRIDATSATPIRCHETWSDDPADPAYNCKRRWGRDAGFSHERLARPDPLYDLIGVLNFNRAVPVAGAGSAIFLHIWRKPRHPTEGCIAFDRRDLIWLHTRLPVGSVVDIRG